ncbi:nSTAND1 domain-containing NTPase [Streptomyces phaeochromogenes]|uniref:nSTAND1 domain-containing NTPase n=1 Tax=Streptomyces phaeochromogenes TaxID=1923 RepID=UPI0033D586F6
MVAPGVVVTCAHVTEAAGTGPGGLVRVVFEHLPGTPASMAEVVTDAWRHPDAEDVAFLRLQNPPAHIAPMVLGSAAGSRGHPVRSFGYTSGGRAGGHFGYGVAGHLVPDNHQEGPALQLTHANDLAEGFSGGPILDETTGLVIGMVNSVARTDPLGRLAGIVFATPTQVLRTIWPDLQISDVCPFRGPEPFTAEHIVWFHGRTEAQDTVIEALTSRRDALMLLGPSGSGKTSLMQAGVLPALAQGAVPGSDRWLPIFLPRPGSDLLAALDHHGLPGASARGIATAVRELLAKQPDYERVLLVIDQFEEIFIPTDPDSAQNPHQTPGHIQVVAAQLLQALATHAPVTLVLVMRNDFYAQLTDQTPALKQALQPLLDIPAFLTRTDLRTIITGPVEHPTASFETGLPARIVNDILTTHDTAHAASGTASTRQYTAGTAPATWLTALQLTLLQLWQRRDDDGRLTHAAYDRIGTVTGALATWCQHAVDQLPEAQQPTARQVLTALVHPPDTNLQLPASRRSLTLETLHELLAPASLPATVDAVLAALTQHRIITLHRPFATAEEESGPARKPPSSPVSGHVTGPEIELVHDSLIRDWPALGIWIAEDQEFYTWLHRTEAQHARWSAGKRAGDLLHGTDLAAGLAWARQRGLPRPITQFVHTSHRRTRIRIQILTGLLVLALIAAGLAAWQRQTAVDAQHKALARLSQQLSLQSDSLINSEPDLASLLAIHAYRTSPTAEAAASLRAAAALPLRRRLTGFTDTVDVLAFSPDGETLATAGIDETVRLWSTGTGTVRKTINGITVAYSPDGRTLATVGLDDIVRLRNTATGTSRNIVTGHTSSPREVAFSPDGRIVATASSDETVRLWSTATGALRDTLTGDKVAFSPDGGVVATASVDDDVRLWSTATGALRNTFTGDAVAFSPDGKTLATGSRDKTVRLWDTASGTLRRTLTGHTDSVDAVAFSPDGKSLATGSWDKTVRLWDPATGTPRKIFIGHTDQVISVAFSPDGKTLATGSYDKTVRLWDAATSIPRRTLTGHTDQVNAVAFSPDRKTLATASADKTVRLWDTATGTLRKPLTGHTHDLSPVAFSPDGKTLAIAGSDKTVQLWDTATGTLRKPLTGHTNDVLSVAFSPDSKTLAIAGSDKTVQLWDTATGALLKTLTGHTAIVLSVAFSPDGKTLATGSWDNTVRLWETATGAHLKTLTGHTAMVLSVAFSPDGKTLASVSAEVRLWDTTTWTPLKILTGHTNAVRTVAFSPDGKTLATGGGDKTVRLWDTSTGTSLTVLAGHAGSVQSVAFSPDGRTLASASADKTVWLWHLPAFGAKEAEKMICAALRRDFTKEERSTDLRGQATVRVCV